MSNQGIPTGRVVKRPYLDVVEEDLDADVQKAYGWYRESSTPDIAARMAEYRHV
jgi:hypothetical protein